jgi:hypothetical protein
VVGVLAGIQALAVLVAHQAQQQAAPEPGVVVVVARGEAAQIQVEVVAALAFMVRAQAGLVGLLPAGTVLGQGVVLVVVMEPSNLLVQTFTPQTYYPPPVPPVEVLRGQIPLGLRWQTAQ